MEIYFFGVINPYQLGHKLYKKNDRFVSRDEELSIPFKIAILDTGLLPKNIPERQGDLYLSIINGWTILGMWDRTGDPRSQSNASFLTKGEYNINEMKEFASESFPEVWERIQKPW